MDAEVYIFVCNIHQRMVGNLQLLGKSIMSFMLFENCLQDSSSVG